MKETKKIDKQKILILVQIIIFFCLMFNIGKVLLSTDDEIYRDAFNGLATFFPWTEEVFKLWSGRIPILALTNLFMHMPIIIFRICNAAVFTSIIISINIIINIINDGLTKKVRRRLLYVTFAMIFFVNIVVLSGGAFWLCGALNYLWPFAFMLISIIPFIAKLKNKELKGIYYIFFILANIISCFSEQSGAILIAFGTITMLYCAYNKIKPGKLLIIHYLIIIIITIISLKAPGNEVRFYAEQTRWYPEFTMLSMEDKLLQGYINLAGHLLNYATLLCFILASTAAYLIIKNKNIRYYNKAISTLPVAYFGLKLITKYLHIESIDNLLFAFNKYGFNNLYSLSENLKVFLSLIILGIIAAELIFIWKDKKDGIIAFILYCAGLCSAMAMSFSPTIYASGNRTFFATDFLIILLNTLLISEIFKNMKNKKIQIVFIIILLILAMTAYINIYNNYLTEIIW